MTIITIIVSKSGIIIIIIIIIISSSSIMSIIIVLIMKNLNLKRTLIFNLKTMISNTNNNIIISLILPFLVSL